MLLIINNESKFIKIFQKELERQNIEYEIINHDKRIDMQKYKDVKGVILSGGSIGLYDKSNVNDYVALNNFNVPIIGFCMGHELIAVAFGGAIEKLPKAQMGMEEVVIDKGDKIFKGLKDKIFLKEKHTSHVSRLPENFEILAHSDVCPIEVMKHKNKPIYGFQSHPEVLGNNGKTIMKNFLEMCGIKFTK